MRGANLLREVCPVCRYVPYWVRLENVPLGIYAEYIAYSLLYSIYCTNILYCYFDTVYFDTVWLKRKEELVAKSKLKLPELAA